MERLDTTVRDETFMDVALAKAREARDHDDVPVGCVVVLDGEVLGLGENRREVDGDPTAHAEIVALRDAVTNRPGWRLEGVTVFVTLEPCVMCAGALLNARVERLVVGAMDEKAGAVGSRYNVLSDPRLLHEVQVTYNVREPESRELLSAFFASRRG
jgi:tRNA(adenine34) deaminase